MSIMISKDGRVAVFVGYRINFFKACSFLWLWGAAYAWIPGECSFLPEIWVGTGEKKNLPKKPNPKNQQKTHCQETTLNSFFFKYRHILLNKTPVDRLKLRSYILSNEQKS